MKTKKQKFRNSIKELKNKISLAFLIKSNETKRENSTKGNPKKLVQHTI